MKMFVANPSKRRKKQQKSRRRANPLPLVIMNSRKRKRSYMAKKRAHHNAGSHKRRRHHNPFRRRHHSRNPFGLSGANALKIALSGAGGVFADVYIPDLLLSTLGMSNTGITAWVAALAVAVLPPWLLSRYPNFVSGWLAGAGGAALWRIYDDTIGRPSLSISASRGTSGFIAPGAQVLPGPNVFGPYARPALPAAVGAARASTGTGMGWVRGPFQA